MIFGLLKKDQTGQAGARLYRGLAAQALQPVFFADYGFADTPVGRFDILALHLFLLNRQLGQKQEAELNHLNQLVFDQFVLGLDDALRQMGIGDNGVAKRKKKFVGRYYKIVHDLDTLLDASDKDKLTLALGRLFYEGDKDHAQRLSDYLLFLASKMKDWTKPEMLAGKPKWPDPKRLNRAVKS